jgi:segregation and condensation protein A
VAPRVAGAPAYTVRLDAFEGPLDLLLHLIRREEMDIYDIPIARITRQYLEHLEGLASLDLDMASEFLLMAATLMDIKSRLLLPRPASNAFIDEEAQADPRQELVRRLLEYKRYKEAAGLLSGRAAAAGRSHSRYGGASGPPPPARGGAPGRQGQDPAAADEEPAGLFGGGDAPGAEASEAGESMLDSLILALQEVMQELDRREPGEIARESLTVGDMIAELVSALVAAPEGGLDFLSVLRRARTRRAAVVAFLALLELARQGWVGLAQEQPFGPVRVWARPGIEKWRWPGRE